MYSIGFNLLSCPRLRLRNGCLADLRCGAPWPGAQYRDTGLGAQYRAYRTGRTVLGTQYRRHHGPAANPRPPCGTPDPRPRAALRERITAVWRFREPAFCSMPDERRQQPYPMEQRTEDTAKPRRIVPA